MFNIGDRVIATGTAYVELHDKWIGQKGTIIGLQADASLNIKFDNGAIIHGCSRVYFEELKEEQNMELKVGDRFYFPKQTVGDYECFWDKSGVITGDLGDIWRIKLDNGETGSCYKWRLQKEAKVMTKDQLKTGMLVQHKNNEWSIVMLGVEHGYSDKDTLLCLEDMCRRPIDRYNDNLENTYNSDGDIIKVATVEYIGDIFRRYKSGGSMESISGFKVLWMRESEQEVKLKKVIGELKEQLKKAEGKLEAIGGMN